MWIRYGQYNSCRRVENWGNEGNSDKTVQLERESPVEEGGLAQF